MLKDNWYEDVLTFWFDEMSPKQWYVSSRELDQQIKARFQPIIKALVDAPMSMLTQNPKTCLAAILCFDQFTRNAFRGDGEAFAYDDKAQELAKYYVAQAWDKTASKDEKQFAYMPFMHSEKPEDQATSVRLFKTMSENSYEFAIKHKVIIDQFGRYPHRNAAMGRTNTKEEDEYLKTAERFGQ